MTQGNHRRACRVALVLLAFLTFAWSPAWGDDRLIYVISLVRHGDRTPYSAPGANLRCTWPARPGELTPLGMQQEYRLGAAWRHTYVEVEHLLPSTYDPVTLRVTSTPMNRTIVSASCLLVGLYPPGTGPRLANGDAALPGGMQPIPVYTLPNDVGNFINPAMHVEGETRRLLTQALREPAFTRLQAEHQADMKRWEALTGGRLSNLVELMETADYLNCMLAHDQPLPPGLDKTEARRIVELGFRTLASLYARADVTRAMTRTFLSNVVATLREVARLDREGAAPSRRMEIYAGHDVSILALLTALGQPLVTNPPYASHIELELRRGADARYEVCVRFNDHALVLDGATSTPLERLAERLRPITEAAPP